MGWLTEKPNRYPIFLKTDTDTDFGILKNGKYWIPTKNNWNTDTVGYFVFISRNHSSTYVLQ